MANEVLKELVDSAAVTAAGGNIGDAVGAGKKFNVKSVVIANLSAQAQVVRVRLGPASYLAFDTSIAIGDSLIATGGPLAVMAAGEQVNAKCSTNNGVSLLVSGVEEDA